MIEAFDLSKRYGRKVAVDGLSFRVPPGHVTGFLGPNGAGKSTTMRLVLGLDAPTSGRVTINGRAYTDLREPLRSVGALLDPNAVDPRRSAAGHLRWLADSNGIDRGRVEEVLGLVGLGDVAGKNAGTFSLGMHQRLGLAAALIGDPETLVLDEPANGLDPEGIQWMRGFLRGLANQGRTVFVSSHLMSEVALTADHLVVIGRGRLIADASMDEIVRRHSRASVIVRAVSRESELRDSLVDHGAAVALDPEGRLSVSGLASGAIGALATNLGIALAELTPEGTSLEDAFMELTHDDTDHRSALAGATH